MISRFGTLFHSVVTNSSLPLAISRFGCVSIIFVFGTTLRRWPSASFMNSKLQPQRRSSRKGLVAICGGIALVVSGIFGGIAFRHIRWVDKRGRMPATARVSTRNEPDVPRLTIEHIIQHGHIVEIQASVPPGATVLVNGERAAVIW